MVNTRLLGPSITVITRVDLDDLESYTALIEGLLEAHGRVKQYYSYIVMRQVKNTPIPASRFVWPGIEVEDAASDAAAEK